VKGVYGEEGREEIEVSMVNAEQEDLRSAVPQTRVEAREARELVGETVSEGVILEASFPLLGTDTPPLPLLFNSCDLEKDS
jgi:hypothetical protein